MACRSQAKAILKLPATRLRLAESQLKPILHWHRLGTFCSNLIVMPQPVPATPDNIERAAAILRDGGIVGMPTETVYGLAADALNPDAVAKVFAAKQRPSFDPLIAHFANPADIDYLIEPLPDIAHHLIQSFWPGPMTLLAHKKIDPVTNQPLIPDLVTSGLPTVALRVPAHPVAQQLIAKTGRPLAAPSANPFGGISPTTAQHVAEGFNNKSDDAVGMILDAGPCTTGVESTVISTLTPQPPLTPKQLHILRLGGLAIEDIQASLDQFKQQQINSDQPIELILPSKAEAASKEKMQAGQQSPGMLTRHYAPRTPLYLTNAINNIPDTILNPPNSTNPRIGLLILSLSNLPSPLNWQPHTLVELSPKQDLTEAAAQLFAAMRQLDASKLDLIIAQTLPPQGLGLAINDRLTRAADRILDE